jgi:hypothetical protein
MRRNELISDSAKVAPSGKAPDYTSAEVGG